MIEKIGLKRVEFDTDSLHDRFDNTKTIGLIVEVKSGEGWDRLTIFEDGSRMEYALGRLGFLTPKQVKSLACNSNWSMRQFGEFQVGKLLVHDLINLQEKYNKQAVPLKLSIIKKFIEKRFNDHGIEKFASRLFFPSSLMQFLTWERHRRFYPNE